MPLPEDDHLLKLSSDILSMFDTLFGLHPGFRAAHAKGTMLGGTFTPSASAKTLSNAPHLSQPSTPITVRFSNSTGVPVIPDNDGNADPRGMAIRFHLGERKHTDIVSHSTDGFPTRTGEEFLELLKALAATGQAPPDKHPTPIEAFLGAHPAALAFVQTPKPAPSSFARNTYFGVTAFKFMDAKRTVRFGRYRLIPAAGNDFLDAEATKSKSATYLMDEIQQRIAAGSIEFKLAVQLAEQGDTVDDATSHWPAEREVRELGTIKLTKPLDSERPEEKRIIFDPIPRVVGIDVSGDPLLELRAAIYLMSGRRRRMASGV